MTTYDEISSLEHSVDALLAERDALRASHRALVEALEAMQRRYDFDDVLPIDHPVVQARAALEAARKVA